MATMDEYGLFWDSSNGDRTYNAESFETWLKKFFYSGVFANEMEVTASSGMTVSVSGGYANVDGKVKNFQSTTLTLSAANSTYPRIDTIVITRNNTDRNITMEVVTGEYSGDNPLPTPPVRNNDKYQLVIANVRVNAGVTEITQADITDTRANTGVCGYVTGTVNELDWDQLTAQFDAFLAEWNAENTEEFQEWFQEMKDQLSTDAAGHLQAEIDDIDPRKNILPDQTDLDDVLTPGVYHLTNAGGTSYLNMPPYESWGLLEVYISSDADTGVSKNAVQKFTMQSTVGNDWRAWVRFWTGAEWTMWRCLGGRVDVSNRVNSVDECTLDNLLYYFDNSKDFGLPAKSYYHVWNHLAYAQYSAQYLTQFASLTNTQSPTIWVRTRSQTGGWGNWHLLAGRQTKTYTYNGIQIMVEKVNRICRLRIGGTSTAELAATGTKTLCNLDEEFRPVAECTTFPFITQKLFTTVAVRTGGNVDVGTIWNLSGSSAPMPSGSTPRVELTYMTY